MNKLDPAQLNALREEGRFGDLLALLQQSFAAAEQAVAPTRYSLFITMFEWKLLLEHYGPARAALQALRDDQAAQMLAGDWDFGRDGVSAEPGVLRASRFSLVVDMNEMLEEPRATHALFVQLDARAPQQARRYAWQVLPALVEVGDFTLADRYRGDPLELLGAVNEMRRNWPLFPPPGMAPRLAGEMMNLTRAVRIGMAVLRGQGHDAEAGALGEALLAGLKASELRALALRELDEPGTISRELVDRQIAGENPG